MARRPGHSSPILYTLNNFNPLVQPYFRQHITAILELSSKVGATGRLGPTTLSPTLPAPEGQDRATTVCGNAALPPDAVARSFFHGRPGKPANNNSLTPSNLLSQLEEIGWEWFDTKQGSNLKGDVSYDKFDLAFELQGVFLRDVEAVLGSSSSESSSKGSQKGGANISGSVLSSDSHPHFNSLLRREQARGYTKDFAVYFAKARMEHLEVQTKEQLKINKEQRLKELKDAAGGTEEGSDPTSSSGGSGSSIEEGTEGTPSTTTTTTTNNGKVNSAWPPAVEIEGQHKQLMRWLKGERESFLSQVGGEPTTAQELICIVVGGRVAQDAGTLAVQLSKAPLPERRDGAIDSEAPTETLFSTPATESDVLKAERIKDYEQYAQIANKRINRIKTAWALAYAGISFTWFTLSLYFEVLETQMNLVMLFLNSLYGLLLVLLHHGGHEDHPTDEAEKSEGSKKDESSDKAEESK